MTNRWVSVDAATKQFPASVIDRLSIDLNVYSVTRFGAVGDGLTDDTAAIQAAVDAVSADGGGTLLFPAADYYMQTSVHLRDDVNIVGYGAAIIKRFASDWVTSFYTLSFRGTGYGAGASQWSISGLEFRGIANTKTCAISLHHPQDFRIADCTFVDAQGADHAIDMQGARRGIIERCRFLGYEPGSIDKEAIQIDHSYRGGGPLLPESSGNYSRYDGIGCRDITVRDCTAARSTTEDAPNLVGSHSYIDANYHRRIRVENNFIEVTIAQNATSTNRRGSVHFVCAQDVIIQGNTFQNIASATQTAIRFRGNTTGFASTQWQTATPSSSTLAAPMQPANITIRGNTFLDFNNNENGNLVHIWGVDDTVNATFAEGIVVDGNAFRNCVGVGGGTNGVTLTYFQFARDVSVQGNSSDKSRQLAYVESSKNVAIVGNTSHDSTFVSFRPVSCSGTVIAGNTVNGSDEFVLVESSTDTIIQGNTFVNKTGTGRADAIMVRNTSVGFLISNNVIRGGSGTMTNCVRTEGTSTGGIASANLVGTGYGTAFSTEAGSAITVTGTVTA